LAQPTTRCPGCDRPVARDDDVCPHCGEGLVLLCEKCGAGVHVHEAKCGSCGHSRVRVVAGPRPRKGRQILLLSIFLLIAGGGALLLGPKLSERDDDPKAALARARAAHRRGDLARAKILLEAYLLENGDDPRALRLLGITLRGLGDPEGATARLERCLELLPDDPAALLALAIVRFEQEDDDGALRVARKALAAGAPAAGLVLGKVLVRSGADPEAAFRHLGDAIQEGIADLEAHVLLGRALTHRVVDLVRERSEDDARLLVHVRARLRQALREEESPERRELLARVHLALGEGERARDALRTLPKELPTRDRRRLLDVLVATRTGRSEDAARLAGELAASGTEAGSLLDLVALLLATNPGALESVVAAAGPRLASDERLARDVATRVAGAASPEVADRALAAIGRARPADARLPARRARVRLETDGDEARAVELLGDGGPEPERLRALGSLLLDPVQPREEALSWAPLLDARPAARTRTLERAVRALATLAASHPEDESVLLLRAALEAALGEPARRDRLLRGTGGARGPEVLLARAEIRVRTGRLDAALEDLRAVLERNPGDSRTLRLLARAHLRRVPADAVAAVEALTRAAETPGAPAGTRLELIDALARAGRVQDAARELGRLLGDTPPGREAPELLALSGTGGEAMDEAIRLATEAVLKEEPDHLTARLLAAMRTYRDDNASRARGELARLVEKHPEAFVARGLLFEWLLRVAPGARRRTGRPGASRGRSPGSIRAARGSRTCAAVSPSRTIGSRWRSRGLAISGREGRGTSPRGTRWRSPSPGAIGSRRPGTSSSISSRTGGPRPRRCSGCRR
jgi:tetratricopeptide (TPR) repeat protein